jgi:hypothetical protein
MLAALTNVPEPRRLTYAGPSKGPGGKMATAQEAQRRILDLVVQGRHKQQGRRR